MTEYAISERFKSVQGEGVYAGTPMAFIRFVGCSVGKKVCHACDTDWEKMHGYRGGGMYSARELRLWAHPFKHICLTGGEPFDQPELVSLVQMFHSIGAIVHIETSGTIRRPDGITDPRLLWVCVSPKPGFREAEMQIADEIKVIVPGLGRVEDWPTLGDALKWAEAGKTVFLQPRNSVHKVDADNLALCQQLVLEHPQLRLSVQLHKLLEVR